MNPKLQSLYGLKFNPFRPDVPVDALYTTPAVDAFLRRVQLGIADGGYVMITGDPGTGKSVALRLLSHRLESLRDVVVGRVEHPQSRTMDFYRELGDLFGVPLAAHNRWGGFKALRSRWAGFMVVAESGFFVPLETYALIKNPSPTVVVILILNVAIVVYLHRNRARLFRHRG